MPASWCCLKPAFHAADTDKDIIARILADTSDTHDFLELFLWREDVGVGVGVVECGLKRISMKRFSSSSHGRLTADVVAMATTPLLKLLCSVIRHRRIDGRIQRRSCIQTHQQHRLCALILLKTWRYISRLLTYLHHDSYADRISDISSNSCDHRSRSRSLFLVTNWFSLCFYKLPIIMFPLVLGFTSTTYMQYSLPAFHGSLCYSPHSSL